MTNRPKKVSKLSQLWKDSDSNTSKGSLSIIFIIKQKTNPVLQHEEVLKTDTYFTVTFCLFLAFSLGTVTAFSVEEREKKTKRSRKKGWNKETKKYKLRVGKRIEC